MTSGLRGCVLAASAAALISTQAYAAPAATTAPAVDPLVSLSMLGTTQSRAAVCATGASCVLPTTMAAATTTAAAQDYDDDDGKNAAWIWIVGGGVLLAILIALILSGGDGDGDLTPVSPD